MYTYIWYMHIPSLILILRLMYQAFNKNFMPHYGVCVWMCLCVSLCVCACTICSVFMCMCLCIHTIHKLVETRDQYWVCHCQSFSTCFETISVTEIGFTDSDPPSGQQNLGMGLSYRLCCSVCKSSCGIWEIKLRF